MTPKEKAEELVRKIDSKIVYAYKADVAKNIALMFVDEIIGIQTENTIFDSDDIYGIDLVCYDCWLEVKQEIEKL